MNKNVGNYKSDLAARAAVGAIASSLIFGIYASPAGAEDQSHDESEAIAQKVVQAAPDGAIPIQGVQTDKHLTTLSGKTSTVISLDADEPIVVTTTIDGANIEAEIVLPESLSLQDASVSDSGTVVFLSEDAGSGAALAVQTLEGGSTRVQTIIPDAGSDHEYSYSMNNYQAVVDQDGNAWFLSNGKEALLVPVEAAWAVDANGESVDTHYVERDGALVQIIEPSAETAYPIVADPTWGWRNGAYGQTLSRSEVNSAVSYAGALGMCSAIASNLKAKGIAFACGGYAGYLSVQATTANRQNPKGCLHLVALPVPGALLHVRC